MADTDSCQEAATTHEMYAPECLNRDRAHPALARKAMTTTARNPYTTVLRLIRRGHLFTGLFMTPWVFLYGISGLLFNHPEAFSDREVQSFGQTESAGTGLENFPGAATIATRVVEAINASSSDRALRLLAPNAAAFTRDLTATVKADGVEYRIQLALESGRGTVSPVRPKKARINDGAFGGRVELKDPASDRLSRAIPALAEKLGLNPKTTAVKAAPDVVFGAESRGKVYRLAYNLQTAVVTSHEDGDESEGLTTRAFLTQLHKTRTFPDRMDTRWIWAVGVDATSALMVLWGISGLIMWWQIKSTRRWGLLVLAASGMTAAALALAMHRVLFYT
jgi:hypothetical protein